MWYGYNLVIFDYELFCKRLWREGSIEVGCRSRLSRVNLDRGVGYRGLGVRFKEVE